MDKKVKINGKELTLSNQEKVYWPKEKYTKGELIEYYMTMSKFILPYIKNRPHSLNRHPNGISRPGFYQKNTGDELPDWIQQAKIYSESNDKYIKYFVVTNEASLIYMVNLGCIEINPWFSDIKDLENPDYIALDLDPLDISFDKVIETALALKEILEKARVKGYCKTSGATGLHIYIPLKKKYDYDVARQFALVIAQLTHELVPDFTSLERNPSKRRKKIYLDYLQNRTGQTLAAPYSVRPKPGATVSTPLDWKEVKVGLTPTDFTIKTIPKRVHKKGDLFHGVLGSGVSVIKALNNLGLD